MQGLLVACRYLTAVPLPRKAGAGDLARGAGWFPVVGLLLGLVLAASARGAGALVPPLLAAALVVAVWTALTGAIHLDGLADTLDGLGGGWSREEALAIMRDVRLGAYGVTGIALVLVVKVAALAGLPPGLAWRALVVAPVAGRLAPLALAALCPPAREEGAGHAFAMAATGPRVAAAAVVATAVCLGALGPWGLVFVGLAGGLAGAFAVYLRLRLGGLTGDCLGALVEGTEATALALVAALTHLGVL